jgi:charged multivesicular body protein 4
VFEDNLVVTQKHINTLEQQMNAVETANLNMETIKVMKQAASAMQGMHKGVGVEDIDTTMYVLAKPLLCQLLSTNFLI